MRRRGAEDLLSTAILWMEQIQREMVGQWREWTQQRRNR
jgi:hypothetical protein